MATWFAKWMRDEDGITITEVVAAVLILGLAIAGLSATLINSLDLTRQNSNRVIAANLAATEIDQLLTLPFGVPASGGDPATGLLALVGTEELDPIEVDGRPFTITRDIYWSTNQADPGPCTVTGADAADENVLRIDVSVTWPRPGMIPPVRSSTSVAPPVDLFDSTGGIIAVYVVDDANQPVEGVDVNLIGPTETAPSTRSGITNAAGCAVFEDLGIGTYRPVIYESGFVDIDQRITVDLPFSVDDIGDSDVSSIQGVAARSRATVEFVYAEANELTVSAQAWDGGSVPDGLSWAYSNSRGDYAGPEFGESQSVYPGSYQVYSSNCEVADPESYRSEIEDGEEIQVPRWPDATRDSVTATPAGGATTDGLVTLGSVDVLWSDETLPDPDRTVQLRAVSLDDECAGDELALAPTAVGADAERFGLPWGNWRIEAVEGGTVVASGEVLASPDDVGDTVPAAELDLQTPPEPGPAGVDGPAMWLDAADTASVSLSGDRVTQWRDQTSAERHAQAQGGDASQSAEYIEGALNDLPVLRFGDGQALTYDGSFLAGTDYTVVAVTRRNAVVDGHNYFMGGQSNGPSNGNLHLGYVDDDVLTHRQWDNDYDANVDPWQVGEPARIQSFLLDQAEGRALFQDGELLGSLETAAGQQPLVSNDDARLGRFLDDYFQGDIAEIVVYPRALTDSERSAVEVYLADKWIADTGPIEPPTGPGDIPGLQLWVDADDASTLFANSGCTNAASTGGSVRCWADKSGNGRNATQPSNLGATHPTYAANGMNGRSVLRLNGQFNYLLYPGEFLVGRDYTIAVVHRRTSGAANNYYLGGPLHNGNDGGLRLGYPVPTRVEHRQGNRSYDTTIPGYSGGEAPRVHTYLLDQGIGKYLMQDGEVIASRTQGAPARAPLAANSDRSIGRTVVNGDYFGGDIAEIVMYDRALTDVELESLHEYLSDKWGTP